MQAAGHYYPSCKARDGDSPVKPAIDGSEILLTRSRFCTLPLHVLSAIVQYSTRQNKTGWDSPHGETYIPADARSELKLVHCFAMPRLGMGRSAEPVTVVAAPACIRRRELASVCLRVMPGSTCPALSAATPCCLALSTQNLTAA